MSSVRRFLETRLKLQVNTEKSAVRPTAELTFLGFAFKGVRIVWSEKSLQRFQHRIRELTSRNWGVSMDYRLRHLALYMRGWMGYFSLSQTYGAVRQLDHWIRRRPRCCYWFRAQRQDRARSEPEQMWKTRSQRIRQLLRLGVKRRDAILHGLGSHGCWAMSMTPAVNQALSLQWLREQGLPSLTEQWVAIHYPTTVR
jgi:RNA-directed DNA polymerase